MSGTFERGVAGIRPVKLTVNTVTDIVAETNACLVKHVYCTEIAGANPTLTLEVYDGTTSTYLTKAKSMTALQTLRWEDIPLNPGMKLRATAGTANQIDVIAVVVEPGQG